MTAYKPFTPIKRWGRLLRGARLRARLSLVDLAVLVNLHWTTLHKYEWGSRRACEKNLLDLLHVLCPVEDATTAKARDKILDYWDRDI